MTILERLQELFRDVLEDDTIVLTKDSSPADIEAWDSLAQLTLTMEAENTFGIKLTTDEILNIKTVGDFVRVIEEKKRSK